METGKNLKEWITGRRKELVVKDIVDYFNLLKVFTAFTMLFLVGIVLEQLIFVGDQSNGIIEVMIAMFTFMSLLFAILIPILKFILMKLGIEGI